MLAIQYSIQVSRWLQVWISWSWVVFLSRLSCTASSNDQFSPLSRSRIMNVHHRSSVNRSPWFLSQWLVMRQSSISHSTFFHTISCPRRDIILPNFKSGTRSRKLNSRVRARARSRAQDCPNAPGIIWHRYRGSDFRYNFRDFSILPLPESFSQIYRPKRLRVWRPNNSPINP